jgi:hypothetical protein
MRDRRHFFFLLGGLATAVAAVAIAIPASPATAGKRKPVSFSGSCELAGTLRQDPPLTNETRPGAATAKATGPCEGELVRRNGRTLELDGHELRYFAYASGESSCGGGTAEGRGVLRYRKSRVRFAFSEVRGPGAGTITLTGARSGSASGLANVAPDADPAEIATRCAGEGLDEVPIEIRISSEGISG